MRRRREMTDSNEKEIVRQLRSIPGVSVSVDKDDIFVGYEGKNYWYEIKNPNVANKAGVVKESAKKDNQKELEKHWPGHYRIVCNLDQILEDLFDEQ